jgi:hypothetical protein
MYHSTTPQCDGFDSTYWSVKSCNLPHETANSVHVVQHQTWPGCDPGIAGTIY